MTPLQKIAMGLVIVVLDAYLGGFDAVPDVLGWVLVVLGLVDLRTVLSGSGILVTLATASAAVSATLLWPGLAGAFPQSTGWLLSVPQLAFSIILCASVASLATVDDPDIARRFSWLRWVFVGLVFAPVVLYGGGVDALLIPVAVATVAANLYLIYLLFRISKRPYALAPADVAPADTQVPAQTVKAAPPGGAALTLGRVQAAPVRRTRR